MATNEEILKGKIQVGAIAFGGTITNEDHIQLHTKSAMVNGYHVVIEADHAKLFRALPAEPPILMDNRVGA